MKRFILAVLAVFFTISSAQAAIKMRRDSAADWTSNDPTLADGEIGYETDTKRQKIGNGSSAWTALGYLSAPVTTNSVATTYTIGTDNIAEAYGGTVYVTSATTVTAPAIGISQSFCVVTIGDIAVSLDVNASDKMILDGVALADGDKATNTSKAGDTICCQYYSADGQYCWSSTVLGGKWTDGN